MILFCATRGDAAEVANQVRLLGFLAACVHGETDAADRQAFVKMFKKAKIRWAWKFQKASKRSCRKLTSRFRSRDGVASRDRKEEGDGDSIGDINRISQNLVILTMTPGLDIHHAGDVVRVPPVFQPWSTVLQFAIPVWVAEQPKRFW